MRKEVIYLKIEDTKRKMLSIFGSLFIEMENNIVIVFLKSVINIIVSLAIDILRNNYKLLNIIISQVSCFRRRKA